MIKNKWRRISSSLDPQWTPIGSIRSSRLVLRTALMSARCRRCDRWWEWMRHLAFLVVTTWERGMIPRYRGWCWPRWEKDSTTHRAWNRTRISRSNSCDLACLSCGALIAHSDGRLPSTSTGVASSFCHGFRLAAWAARIPAGFRLSSGRSPHCTFVLRCWWGGRWDPCWVSIGRMRFSCILAWRDGLWVSGWREPTFWYRIFFPWRVEGAKGTFEWRRRSIEWRIGSWSLGCGRIFLLSFRWLWRIWRGGSILGYICSWVTIAIEEKRTRELHYP